MKQILIQHVSIQMLSNIIFFQKMLTSILYPPNQVTERLKEHHQNDNINHFHLVQIIFMKILVVSTALVLPLFMKDDNACLLLAIFIALQFWINKNLAKSFLRAHWFVDTSTQKDTWVFEAKPKSTDAAEGLFWYSSLGYLLLLLMIELYYLSNLKHRMSMACVIGIGIACAYLNFFSFSKIIMARNSGALAGICEQVNGPFKSQKQNKQTVQIPLIRVRSQLKS